MAFNRSGNMVFIDTASNSITDATLVLGMIIHCTHASNPAVIILGDNVSGTSYPTLFSIEVAAADEYQFLDFSACPLRFPNGIRAKTLTDVELTLIIANARN